MHTTANDAAQTLNAGWAELSRLSGVGALIDWELLTPVSHRRSEQFRAAAG